MLPANLTTLLNVLQENEAEVSPFAAALRKELEAMNQDAKLSQALAKFADDYYAAAAGPRPPADYCIMCGQKK